MYTKNNKIYSEAFKYLVSDNSVGYELPIDNENVYEIQVDLTDMLIREGSNILVAICSNEKVTFLVSNNGSIPTYASLKTDIIKSRYSNDDQIAIMLNKDENDEKLTDYVKMQEWRNYATVVAKKIMELYDARGTQSPSGEQQDVEVNS